MGAPRKVAFYAPLKPPDHPAPSGDREMARLLMAALRASGHEVTLISSLRTYLRDPLDHGLHARLHKAAERERERIDARWRREGAPDLWVSYHPYYKSPDLLGPPLCRSHKVPWVTVEASQSLRRSVGAWAEFQARALDAVQGARTNIALTWRDEEGLHEVDPKIRVSRLSPFIDASPFLGLVPDPEPGRLVTVAMMRAGDKARSYAILADAMRGLSHLDLKLTVIGDGPARAEIEAAFHGVDPNRVDWRGLCDRAAVCTSLEQAEAFVWPGCGEAFGIAYLEAQAAGLPVVALRTGGVPEVVLHGETGFLAENTEEFGEAIRHLITDPDMRRRLGASARERVRSHHDLIAAANRIEAILNESVWTRRG